METYGRIQRKLLSLFILMPVMHSCGRLTESDACGRGGISGVDICISTGWRSRASPAPPEYDIHDLCIFIFDEYGDLEEEAYFPKIQGTGEYTYRSYLVAGKRYTICACANTGYRIKAETLEELEAAEYHLAYPDEYSHGIPMAGSTEVRRAEKEGSIILQLERLMAKISLRIDRSRLSEGVDMDVTEVRIGNCPKKVTMFTESRVEDAEACFITGLVRKEDETYPLNTYGTDGVSGEVDLYMLENMQGIFSDSKITEDRDKILDGSDPRSHCASFIEVSLTYLSDERYTAEKDLKYRFYLGGTLNDLDIERNCHYRIVITPHDDGLNGDGWRVDKEGICSFVRNIELSAESMEFSYIGQTGVISAQVLPEDCPEDAVCWESSNANVAEVSQTGCVTATGEGTCIIRCTSTDGSGISSECNIIVDAAPSRFSMEPSGYIEGKTGDRLHFRCEIFPPDAPFDIGTEELEFDRLRGLYDYEIDKDGLGVTITLKKPGSGIIYMSAGSPINMSEIAYINITE